MAAPLAPIDSHIPEGFDAARYLAGLGLLAGRFHLFPGVWGLHKGHDVLTEAIEMSPAANPVVVTCGLPGNGINGSTAAVATLAALCPPLGQANQQKKTGCGRRRFGI